jgi:ADP-ribose pyrophosphatase YjhB (NUDIX family)
MTNQDEQMRTAPPGIVVCVGAVVLEKGKILFVRQAAGHPLAKQWSIPWGLLEPGETPEEAVLREVKEEAGVKAEVQGLLGIQNLPDPWDGWLGLIFQCKHISGVPKPDGGIETDRARYFSMQDLVMMEEKVEIWCEWLAKRVLKGKRDLISPEPSNPYSPKIAFL